MPTASEAMFGPAPGAPADTPPEKKPAAVSATAAMFGPQAGTEPPPPPDDTQGATGELRKPTWRERVALTGLRVGAPIVAGIVTAPISGPGALAASAAAGTGAEYAAEAYEKAHGLRKDISGTEVALAAPFSAIPGAKFERIVEQPLLRIGARALEGATIGGAQTVARAGLEEGRLPTASEAMWGAGVGAAFGTGGGVVEHALGAGRAAPRPEMPAGAAGGTEAGAPGAAATTPPMEAGGGGVTATEAPPPTPTRPPVRPPEPVSEQQLTFPGMPEPPPPPTPMRPVDVTEPTPGAEVPEYGPPVFRRARGAYEATTGREIPPVGERPPERMQGELDAVDRDYPDLPQESRDALKQVKLDQADRLERQTRGVQSIERQKAEAGELQFDPEAAYARGPGETYTGAEQMAIRAHEKWLHETEIPMLAEAVERNPDDAALALQLDIRRNQLVQTVAVAEGAKAEAGRALGALQYQMDALHSGDPEFIRAALKQGADGQTIVNILKKAKTPREKMDALRLLNEPTWRDSSRSFWMSNVLSGPKTHLRNITANTAQIPVAFATTPMAAAMERIRGVPIGERTVFAGEVPHQVAGLRFGLREGLSQAWEVMKHGYSPAEMERWEMPTEMLAKRGPVTRALVNVVPRALSAADVLASTMAEHMELHAGAYAQARREVLSEMPRGGMSSAELKARVLDRMTDLLGQPPGPGRRQAIYSAAPELRKQAAAYAERRVFHEHGFLDSQLIQLKKKFWPLEYVIPFTRTPVALARQGIQMTPAGFFTKLGRGTGRLSSQARAEAALGSLAMTTLAYWASEGHVHGTGPTDPVERDRKYRAGWRPNSIDIGAHSVGFGILGPLAMPLSLIGNGFDAFHEAKKNGDNDTATKVAQQTAMQLFARTGKSFLDQSFIKGLSDLNEMMNNPQGSRAAQFFGSLAQGFIPGSSAIRSVNQALDPTLRQVETPAEYIETGIPGLSQNVPPRLRATGEPIQIEQAGGALGRAISPMDIAPHHVDPIQQELDRIGVRLALPEGEIPAIGKMAKPTRWDKVAVAQAKGRATMEGLAQLFADPGYQQKPPDMTDEEWSAAQAHMAKHMIQMSRGNVGKRARSQWLQKLPIDAEWLQHPTP